MNVVTFLLLCGPGLVRGATETEGKRWTHGLSEDPSFFPIGVWLQNPANAARYKAAGINLYVGLWRGPTSQQLDALKQAGMLVICGQNAVGLERREDRTIVGWMHGDEPDNAQSLGRGKGYGPPVAPAKIVEDYETMRAADPTRPILLNLGQGVAWDQYIGRGVRRNHPEDYPEYIRGCDIVSFDIYPVVHDNPEVAGKLEFVGNGVLRLSRWAGGRRVWNCIECTHIGNPRIKATPEQVRSEVWMSLIHGSTGLIYFVHQFEPTFREAALLDDPEMLSAVTRINREIHDLAPVLNLPNSDVTVEVIATDAGAKIASMQKKQGNDLLLFTVNMSNRATRATIALNNVGKVEKAEVLGESRSLDVDSGKFHDDYAAYAVHAYRVGLD